jgi:hypothetical protein
LSLLSLTDDEFNELYKKFNDTLKNKMDEFKNTLHDEYPDVFLEKPDETASTSPSSTETPSTPKTKPAKFDYSKYSDVSKYSNYTKFDYSKYSNATKGAKVLLEKPGAAANYPSFDYSDFVKTQSKLEAMPDFSKFNSMNFPNAKNSPNSDNTPNMKNTENVKNADNVLNVENFKNVENSDNTPNVKNAENVKNTKNAKNFDFDLKFLDSDSASTSADATKGGAGADKDYSDYYKNYTDYSMFFNITQINNYFNQTKFLSKEEYESFMLNLLLIKKGRELAREKTKEKDMKLNLISTEDFKDMIPDIKANVKENKGFNALLVILILFTGSILILLGYSIYKNSKKYELLNDDIENSIKNTGAQAKSDYILLEATKKNKNKGN